MSTDYGRLLVLIARDIGLNLSGLLDEAEKVPGQIAEIREKIAPLKAELAMLQAKYESKGRSPSHFDIQRSVLLAQLKEEARTAYNRTPDMKVDARGNETPIPLTDGRADDAAHMDQRYKDFVKKANRDQKRIAELGKHIGPLFDKIEVLRGRQRFLEQKIRIGERLIDAWGRERSRAG